jgi:hypothetical protein
MRRLHHGAQVGLWPRNPSLTALAADRGARGTPAVRRERPSHHVTEVRNPYDSGARWCSVVMLARTRPEDPATVGDALANALRQETSRENLRAIGLALAGADPLTV